MTIEVWQMVQIKRVLDTFCSEHQVKPDDAAALEACDQLLGATLREIDNAEQLFDHLCATVEIGPLDIERRKALSRDLLGNTTGSAVS
jgi:hypothetical protein